MKYESKYKDLSVDESIKKYSTNLRLIAILGILAVMIDAFLVFANKINLGIYGISIFLILYIVFIFRNINWMNLNHILYTDCDPQKYLELLNILEKRDKKKRAFNTLNLSKAYGYYYTNELDLMKECLYKVNFKRQNIKILLVTINLWLNYAIKTKNEEIYNEYYNKLYNIVPKNKKEEDLIEEVKDIIKLNKCIEEKNEKEAEELIKKSEQRAKFLFTLVLNNFYKAQVNLMVGNNEEARKNLEFVIENGNTMYKKIEAEELLKTIQ